MDEQKSDGRNVGLSAGLGDWRLKHDLRLRMGITAFGLQAGAIVAVTQLDSEYRKVLVEVGPAMCDWMSDSWLLEHFENVAQRRVQGPSPQGGSSYLSAARRGPAATTGWAAVSEARGW